MIVKDEAAMLPGFLERVRGLWDELVVVDTGSTDNSVALLEAAGARVLHQPWRHDFALARNQSLEAATGEWIIFLDPDEYVSPAFVAQARAVLDDARIGAATVAMQNLREDGHVQEACLLRMFRRAPEVRFRHAIHEDVAEAVLPKLRATGQELVHLAAPITHHGYRKEIAQARNKKQRDTAIIQASLGQDPDDLYLHFKLLEQRSGWHRQRVSGALCIWF
jgi:glycosyltransferase involved in cell wall biosynthesis